MIHSMNPYYPTKPTYFGTQTVGIHGKQFVGGVLFHRLFFKGDKYLFIPNGKFESLGVRSVGG